jgi:hypothetical protein
VCSVMFSCQPCENGYNNQCFNDFSSSILGIDVMSEMNAEYGLSCLSTDHWEGGR